MTGSPAWEVTEQGFELDGPRLCNSTFFFFFFWSWRRVVFISTLLLLPPGSGIFGTAVGLWSGDSSRNGVSKTGVDSG